MRERRASQGALAGDACERRTCSCSPFAALRLRTNAAKGFDKVVAETKLAARPHRREGLAVRDPVTTSDRAGKSVEKVVVTPRRAQASVGAVVGGVKVLLEFPKGSLVDAGGGFDEHSQRHPRVGRGLVLQEYVEQDGRRARLPLDREEKIGLAVAPVGADETAGQQGERGPAQRAGEGPWARTLEPGWLRPGRWRTRCGSTCRADGSGSRFSNAPGGAGPSDRRRGRRRWSQPLRRPGSRWRRLLR